MTSISSSSLFLHRTTAITDDEFRQLRDFIYAKCGIWVDDKRKYLFDNRFATRLTQLGLKSFSDYFKVLTQDINKDKELLHAYELVTTNETSFFRDMKQLDAFKTHILSPLIDEQRKKNSLEINIWSAGCSSGEEPYTLSMLIHELLGPDIKRWRITITAVDLSPEMVAKAKAGIYLDYSFKTTPEPLKKKYFTPEKGGFKISSTVASIINFQVVNLNDATALKRIPKSHVVFCRNVIIYFDVAMKKKIATAFYDNLIPNGFLVLGHSETLHNITSTFRPKFLAGSVAYHKA